MSRVSMIARSSISPARNVFSRMLPRKTFLRRVRTNAEPLPGLTCWKSTTVQRLLSNTIVTPVRKSLVEISVLLSIGDRTWASDARPNTGRAMLALLRSMPELQFGTGEQALDIGGVAPHHEDEGHDAED